MSKVDAQRAMREAKYRNAASGASRPMAAAAEGTSGTPAAPPPTRKPARAAKAAATPEDGERCGHKSMNGRACTREAAHSERSHRYS